MTLNIMGDRLILNEHPFQPMRLGRGARRGRNTIDIIGQEYGSPEDMGIVASNIHGLNDLRNIPIAFKSTRFPDNLVGWFVIQNAQAVHNPQTNRVATVDWVINVTEVSNNFDVRMIADTWPNTQSGGAERAGRIRYGIPDIVKGSQFVAATQTVVSSLFADRFGHMMRVFKPTDDMIVDGFKYTLDVDSAHYGQPYLMFDDEQVIGLTPWTNMPDKWTIGNGFIELEYENSQLIARGRVAADSLAFPVYDNDLGGIRRDLPDANNRVFVTMNTPTHCGLRVATGESSISGKYLDFVCNRGDNAITIIKTGFPRIRIGMIDALRPSSNRFYLYRKIGSTVFQMGSNDYTETTVESDYAMLMDDDKNIGYIQANYSGGVASSTLLIEHEIWLGSLSASVRVAR